MPIDFFDENCQSSTNANEFGLCDDESGTKVYFDRNKAHIKQWIAIVQNNNEIMITLTAIDNCILIRRNKTELENRCDGMLTYTIENNEAIIFFELKNKAKDWIAEAIHQLEVTIQKFLENNDISEFKIKKAFACNRKHPQFQTSQISEMQRFYNRYKIKLLIQQHIII